MDSFWDLCQERFRANLTQQQFSTWIKPLVFEDADGDMRILAPNHFVMDWVREKFAEHIDGWAQEFYARPISITYALGKKTSAPRAHAAPSVTASIPSPANVAVPAQMGMRINPGFTFDNFVSGRANQLARAAALQIADNPGMAYNPLFVYGGVGLGKTHLLQAIGNTVRLANPDARISYIHANDYVDDVVKAYLNKQFDDLKRRYMSLDLLLIDDIQFLAKKDRTQEEFFYVFNSLIENKKQIVITCDTFPKEISGLDDRLKSRFAWGLTVAVEPPELEMRVAILLAKAQAESVKLDENAAFFIAKQVRSNVRELEGALKRVIAFSRFHEKPITLELVKEALRDLIASTSRIVSIENIQKTVADFYKIKVADMFSKKRTRNLARPRQIAMALAKELTNQSLPEIGESFGGRDHTTVIHACRKVAELRETEADIGRDYLVLLQTLTG
ncbi:MAG: chromosomal replication initiation protein DnaA [Thiobacillus sp. 63-78]|uniref:chromosomal replication initiator protein DnaA n=1 Tax=Thiobacillus sp. 63-78 TaxID=1895859 RepID=UPI00086AB852|nr:chromosomal replication initiator protein DnaA [Thiobacillus sp. 63-78]MBN8763709.1 chromosomal replication initiator protein DnaA [Thiobacillus sp.]MBN8772667.1 chromosomal replication initiator protein DnaA [Thiobacillus sp.]ODV10483.1 MAG: chromosomal replication initiation protein DnaA [Thiobacillus sp. SCN 64-317]OJZ15672.1 MAG: chromosomal replication initiation protein DnaA [Thiobacillus sp. 63-78]